MQHASGEEPGRDTNPVHVIQFFDLEARFEQKLSQSGLRVATKMVEGAIERAVNRRHCRDEQQQGAVTGKDSPSGAKEISVAFDVLHDINGDDSISGKGIPYLVEVSLEHAHAWIAGKSPLQLGDVVSCRLDKKEGFRRGAFQNELGNGSDPRSRLGDPFPERSGEGIDNPIVVIGSLGDSVQLGARIGELSNSGRRI
jgi:hypothetical protein